MDEQTLIRRTFLTTAEGPIKRSITFRFERLHSQLLSGVAYKFYCGLSIVRYHGDCVRYLWFNPIQDGPFWYCSQMPGGGRDCSCPTMMKLGSYTLLKEDAKNAWIIWHTPWVLLTTAFFQRKSASFAISRNSNIDCILVHNFWFF